MKGAAIYPENGKPRLFSECGAMSLSHLGISQRDILEINERRSQMEELKKRQKRKCTWARLDRRGGCWERKASSLEISWEGRQEILKQALRVLLCDVTSSSPCKTLQQSWVHLYWGFICGFWKHMLSSEKGSREKIAANQIPGGEARSPDPW